MFPPHQTAATNRRDIPAAQPPSRLPHPAPHPLTRVFDNAPAFGALIACRRTPRGGRARSYQLPTRPDHRSHLSRKIIDGYASPYHTRRVPAPIFVLRRRRGPDPCGGGNTRSRSAPSPSAPGPSARFLTTTRLRPSPIRSRGRESRPAFGERPALSGRRPPVADASERA